MLKKTEYNNQTYDILFSVRDCCKAATYFFFMYKQIDTIDISGIMSTDRYPFLNT